MKDAVLAGSGWGVDNPNNRLNVVKHGKYTPPNFAVLLISDALFSCRERFCSGSKFGL